MSWSRPVIRRAHRVKSILVKRTWHLEKSTAANESTMFYKKPHLKLSTNTSLRLQVMSVTGAFTLDALSRSNWVQFV